MTVQLVAQNVAEDHGVEMADVYLVLPDGSHAFGHCITILGPPCVVESFAPEKRVTQACTGQSGGNHMPAICFWKELYSADRRGNDITLYGANGAVTYHITGSWTDVTMISR
jgi:hypothetical protein